jgi:hypothetical protein
MKMKGVLLYNISADKLKKIRVILLRLGLHGRVVTPEEFMLPVGQLAGIEGLSPAETAQEDAGEVFREEMLVMCDLPSAVFSAFLNALPQNRCTVALKAVLTQTNAGWSSQRLHRELAAEHEAMRNAAKSVHNK